MKFRQQSASYIRNFVFGVEDSLVSTVGLLAGVAVAGVPRADILTTGIILIFVEAFSMGVGSILSEHAASEYTTKHTEPITKSLKGGSVMFTSYFVSGFIPLFPYLIFIGNKAVIGSVIVSLLALFALGFLSGKYSKTNTIREGLEMLVIGGFAVFIGVVVGALMTIIR